MFEIFVDSGANIPAVFVEKYDINVIAFINIVDGRKVPGFESGLSLEEERARSITMPSAAARRSRPLSSTARSSASILSPSLKRERICSIFL